MKTPEEIVKYLDLEFDSEINRNYYNHIIVEAIKEAQIEAWNEALDKAAENAEVEVIDCEYNSRYDTRFPVYGVSTESILKLKI